MSTFGFFSDAGLTTPVTSLRKYSTELGDKLVYFGSPATGKTLQDAEAPGTDLVLVSVVDAAGGTGLPASAVKLAATSGGLATATPGAALSLGVLVASGTANAKPVHVRIDTSGGTVPNEYTDLSLQVQSVIEADA